MKPLGPAEQTLAAGLHQREIPALDAIRAGSVILVMVYHFGYVHIPGAYGVIAFFVLSGFLITWLLLREHGATETISLRNFYMRRALRIFPAFYVFAGLWILALMLAGRTVPWAHATSALLYFSDYFNAILGDPNTGFSHTWSLAIEEQFYLLWPAAVIWLLHEPQRLLSRLGWFILALWCYRVALALVLNVPGGYIYAAFDTRVDALLIGCFAAVALYQGRLQGVVRGILGHQALALVPLAGIVLMAVGWPGLPRQRDVLALALVPVCFAVLIIQSVAFHDRPLWRWMQYPAVRYLGRISYPMYLYQQVVLQPVGKRLPFLPEPLALVIACAATVLVASLSYRVVERPFLRLKHLFASPQSGGAGGPTAAGNVVQPA
jgi:peptidoglycan/LPS O-acetylase OafA/YrhL